MKNLKEELQAIKKGSMPRGDADRRKAKKSESTRLKDRLTFRGDVSPVAGPSGVKVHGSSREASLVNPIPENKEEAKVRVLDMVKSLKDVRKGKVNPKERDASLAAELGNMEWEPLPQRVTRSTGPRVVANVQLVPPCDSVSLSMGKSTLRFRKSEKSNVSEADKKSDSGDASWKEVAGKGKNRKGRQVDLTRSGETKASQAKEGRRSAKGKASGPVRKLPKTAAVSITGRNKDFSYREALLRATKEISLTDLKIETTRLRRAANGGYIIEIMDKDGADKAVSLQEKLKTLLPEDQAVVARPITFGEVRFIGLDVTILAEKVVELIAAEGKCGVDEVKVGSILPMRNGMNTIWARCPLVAASAIASKRKVRIGWSLVKVELLNTRPVQCYKCWRHSHVRFACTSSVDRSRSCFNCGKEGHALRECQMPPHCVLCFDEGRSCDHRLGSALCGVDRKPKWSRGYTDERKVSNRRVGSGIGRINDV
ncbi:hypothetical protein RF55_12668 [Lasius niger]|uniref:CCHC-type domain-containing protein n=1 Tax=Lasius niger TaxID=67767 RepID=A0A0J7KCI8_LASNI|nr:hypothetical protein RF55_12668 [Lasius niger]